MNIDLPLVLFWLTLVSGLIWAWGHWFWRPRHRAAGKDYKEPVLVEYARALFPIFLIVFVLRAFVAEPFKIPSGSMMPTLVEGDFILVNKFSYGIRLPVINEKIIDLGDPQRGDVVVFRWPRDEDLDYIKRVVGIPGDIIEYRDKQIFINGKAQPITFSHPYEGPLHDIACARFQPYVYKEELGGKEHATLICSPDQSRNDGFLYESRPYVVPPGNYFVMGDNRDNSNDSRAWGLVPDKNLKGKAFLIWMNWGEWNRIGDSIQ